MTPEESNRCIEEVRCELDTLRQRIDQLDTTVQRLAKAPALEGKAAKTFSPGADDPPTAPARIPPNKPEHPEPKFAVEALSPQNQRGAVSDGPLGPAVRQLFTGLKEESWDFSRFETVVGQQWMTWLGGLSLILAVGFFVPWAWTHFDAPPWARVALLHAVGAGIVAGGYGLRRRRLEVAGHGVTGVGLFTLYAACFTMHHLYDLGGEASGSLAFFDGCTITAIATLLAVVYNSRGVLLLGALGGYLTPAIAASGRTDVPTLFGYLAFLNIALLTSAGFRRWHFFKPLVFSATSLVFLVTTTLEISNSTRWEFAYSAALHAAIILAATSLPALAWRTPASLLDLRTMAANTMGFMGYIWALFVDEPNRQLGLVALGLASLHFGLSRAAIAPMQGPLLRRTHIALAIALLTLSIPLRLHQTAELWALAWGAEGLAFVAMGVWYRDRRLTLAGVGVFVVSVIRLLGFDFALDNWFHGANTYAGWDRRFLLSTLIGGSLAAAGGSFWCIGRDKRPPARELFSWPLPEALLVAGHLVFLMGVAAQWSGPTGAILATLNAIVFLLIGFHRTSLPVRTYAAFLGLAIALPWTFAVTHDIESPQAILWNGRFTALTMLGLTMVTAGLLHQRAIRHRVASNTLQDDPSGMQEVEPRLEAIVSVVGHLAMLVALSSELSNAFAIGAIPTPTGRAASMVEQASYSTLWAAYAATVVAVGLTIRSRTYRLFGLVTLLAVLAKVFFSDLAQLAWMPRIVALAAIGVALIGVSILYQRYAPGSDDPRDKSPPPG